MADALTTAEDANDTNDDVAPDSSVVESIKSLGPIRLAVMAGVAVILIGFSVFLSMRIGTPSMAPLFNNLSLEDSGEIVAELERQNIAYQLRAGGAQIMVSSDEIARVRMLLAQEGLPGEGSTVGYEIFDQDNAMGTSNFVLNVNRIRALEGEIGRTIAMIKGIEQARVHLVMPKRELFSREKLDPTASVALTMRGGKELTKQEIAAIRHLVATAVPGLKSQKITITDNKGRLLARGLAEGEEEEGYADDAQEYRRNFERRLRNMVENLLGSTIGAGKVRAEVTADIDFDRIVTKSETYDPESQVARSVQETSELEESSERDLKDDVSAANNLPNAEAGQAGTLANRRLERTDATTNFEISKEISNHIRETGTVNKLSIAVLVDGFYTTGEDGTQNYQPRTEEELAQMELLVKSAVGFDAQRGDVVEVVNMAFYDSVDRVVPEEPLAWLRDELQGIVQTFVIGGVAVLAILMIIRPLVTRAIEATSVDPELEAAEKAALAAPTLAAQITDQRFEEDSDEELISIDRVEGRVKSATYRKINELVDQHPDEALVIFRQWMFGQE